MAGKPAKSHSQQTREKLQYHRGRREAEDILIAKLEKLLREQENTEVGDVMREYNLTPEEVAELLKSLKGHVPEEQPSEDGREINDGEDPDPEGRSGIYDTDDYNTDEDYENDEEES